VKVVVYGPEKRVGILQGEQIVDASLAYAGFTASRGDSLPYAQASATAPSSLEQFIEAGDRALDGSQRAVEFAMGSGSKGPSGEQLLFDAASTKLHAPLAHRGVKLIMAGANYADHLYDMMRAQDPNVTMEQVKERSRQRGIGGFWKHPSFVANPGDDISYPAKTKYLDYEGEVTIVIGKSAKDARQSDLLDHIWGYTLQNDWSARDARDNVVGTLAFSLMKNWDGASTVGPCIVTGEIKDPQDVPFQTRVNGELRQDGNTMGMTFSFAEYFEYMTQDITLNPGDLIAAGTCKGTAMDSTPRVEGGGFSSDKLFLKPGDVVEVSSPLIGVLRNRIVPKRST
jgi:2-keto-4-pentenoate hydratase/2-oxohepta-3-ene-1,7-dioic acid hydratase in catechol pathway